MVTEDTFLSDEKKPRVSIIVPCKDIDDYTRDCVRRCMELGYNDAEILVLPDGNGVDLAGARLIATGSVSPGAKRNIGMKNTESELCAFIDSDAYPRRDWLGNAFKHLSDPEIAAVGGPGLTPNEDNLMQKAGGYILSSFMVGSLSRRYQTQGNFASDDIHSCNFIARKSVMEKAGGWNETYWPGEDTLMGLALAKNGAKMIEASDVVVYHHRRPLFRGHLRQVWRFGLHRGFFTKKFPENSRRLTYFLPSLLLICLTGGLLLSFLFHPLMWFYSASIVVY
ncbi:MAG: hypothetical protein QG670_2053, partial [Thermoproteota archaeon]|nr:hypothetical protein [Thermoproteota archaeon]